MKTLADNGEIPANVHNLIEVAIQRLRTRHSAVSPQVKTPSRQDELDTKEKKN